MIYYVEDDDDIRELMLYTLRTTGFEARGFSSSSPFWEAMAEDTLPELILLDIMLPEEDGLEVLKRLRSSQKTKSIPIIMSTAKGTEFDKVTGLDLGADDYLVKPYGMMEMVSRIKAVLRRVPKTNQDIPLSNGGIQLVMKNRTVTVDQKRIELTRKEFDLLALFMASIGRVFTRQELLDAVWGDDSAIETRTVDVHIGTLRTKLDECGKAIQTVRGVGYVMEVLND